MLLSIRVPVTVTQVIGKLLLNLAENEWVHELGKLTLLHEVSQAHEVMDLVAWDAGVGVDLRRLTLEVNADVVHQVEVTLVVDQMNNCKLPIWARLVA